MRLRGQYPVIYWLHGFTGTGLGQANYNPWVPSLPELMDRVIAEGGPAGALGHGRRLHPLRRPRPGDAPPFLRAFDAAPKKPQEMVEALVFLVAMAMAYSPNPATALGFDLPVDVETGELDEAVWARWLAWDPVVMVERHADALRGMRLVYVECGSRDQFALHGARILHRRLERLGVPHEHQEFDDDHTAVNYRYVESLRRLCHALAP